MPRNTADVREGLFVCEVPVPMGERIAAKPEIRADLVEVTEPKHETDGV